MKRIYFVLATIIVLSCKNTQIAHELKSFLGSKITVPQELYIIQEAEDAASQHTLEQALVKMIIWYDTKDCASCMIKNIGVWNDIVKYCNDSIIGFEPIIIFSPNRQNLNEFELQLSITEYNYPIMVDYGNIFPEVNPQIPQNNLYHVFLLDKNNSVVLVGNPLHNYKLWSLYKQTINQLIANGGELPQNNNRKHKYN